MHLFWAMWQYHSPFYQFCLSKRNSFFNKLLLNFRLRYCNRAVVYDLPAGLRCAFLWGQWKALCSDSSSAETKMNTMCYRTGNFAYSQTLKCTCVMEAWGSYVRYRSGHLAPSRKNYGFCTAVGYQLAVSVGVGAVGRTVCFPEFF